MCVGSSRWPSLLPNKQNEEEERCPRSVGGWRLVARIVRHQISRLILWKRPMCRHKPEMEFWHCLWTRHCLVDSV